MAAESQPFLLLSSLFSYSFPCVNKSGGYHEGGRQLQRMMAAASQPSLLLPLFSPIFRYVNRSGGYRAGRFGWERKDRRQKNTGLV
jgi:hypothetical protein